MVTRDDWTEEGRGAREGKGGMAQAGKHSDAREEVRGSLSTVTGSCRSGTGQRGMEVGVQGGLEPSGLRGFI